MNVLITVKTATGDSKVTYTISRENNITAFAKTKEAKSAPDVERFATAKELAKLAEQWPAARLPFRRARQEAGPDRGVRQTRGWHARLFDRRLTLARLLFGPPGVC